VLSLNEKFTLAVIAGQVAVFWQQWRLMARQLSVSAASESS
jgi:hypothetical protein